jgi:hypothetical protein
MKKLLLLLIPLAIGVFAIAVYPRMNPQKRAMEAELKPVLGDSPFYKCKVFEPSEIVFLSDEIKERISYHTNLMNSYDIEYHKDSVKLGVMRHFGNDLGYDEMDFQDYERRMERARRDYEFQRSVVDFLNEAMPVYEFGEFQLDFETHTVYMLVYTAVDQFGMDYKNVCYGRFDRSGDLVAMKVGDGWRTLEGKRYYSIPGYYEFIEQNQ